MKENKEEVGLWVRFILFYDIIWQTMIVLVIEVNTAIIADKLANYWFVHESTRPYEHINDRDRFYPSKTYIRSCN